MAGIPAASQSVAAIVDIMHRVIKDELPRGALVGIVEQSPPELVVRANNIPLTNKDLYCSRYLLPGYTRHVKGETSDKAGGSGDAEYESHRHPIDNDETWTDTLQPGTAVLLIPIYGQDEQLYWVVDSGVKL
ncbi:MULTISPECIES: DUF2577 family protein [unclassified Megasphaera]|uniref:DUF2577 family protein n=1 Tax=unclassified Megasphaera TaxID=2626256 RepID=UPI000ECAA1B5|nr:DUF2577 family protein [Megasphaera sp. UBA4233]HAM04968.1 hypothetical protein [Megasphaera sp.]